MKKRSLVSTHYADVIDHFKNDLLIGSMGLRLVELKACGAAPEPAALFAVEYTGRTAFPGTIDTLGTGFKFDWQAWTSLSPPLTCI